MKKTIYMLFALSVSFIACEPYFSGLDIKNDHDPDIETVMGDIYQYSSLIEGAYKKWWEHMLAAEDGDTWVLATNADAYAPGAGNWGIATHYYYTSYEKPMIANTDRSGVFPKTLWYNHYGKISTVRNMLAEIKNKELIYKEDNEDKTHKILANCYFLIGAFYTELSLLFDQCFIITEDTDLQNVTAADIKPAKEAQALALSYLDKCIEICSSKTFSNFTGLLPSNVIDDNNKLLQLANFMAARALVYHPRNKTEYESIDWVQVKKYISNGLVQDIKADLPLQGWEVWSFAAAAYPETGQWARVGLRVINMMAYPDDPGAIWPLPTSFVQGKILPEAQSPDYRLGTDFVYTTKVTAGTTGISYDGYNKYSSYLLQRFSETGQESGEGELFFFMKAESDLLYAEACLQTGEKAQAAELINITRKERGKLEDITSGSPDDELLEAIYYERFVECGYAYAATSFYDRRRTPIDKFQLTTRSFRQLPIPVLELSFYDLESYTFGGELDKNDDYKF